MNAGKPSFNELDFRVSNVVDYKIVNKFTVDDGSISYLFDYLKS